MYQPSVSELSDVFNDNLVYEGTVPLTYQHLDKMPDDDELSLININNEKVLRMVAALDEMHIDTREDPGHTHDIARLEFKINMLMDPASSCQYQCQRYTDRCARTGYDRVRSNTQTVGFFHRRLPQTRRADCFYFQRQYAAHCIGSGAGPVRNGTGFTGTPDFSPAQAQCSSAAR